jgi:hypothetical protein
MPSYKHLKGVAAGLAGTFVSRNNDIGGYWAIGIIYDEVADSGCSEITFNLQDAQVSPQVKCAGLMLSRYRETTDRMLQNLGLSWDDLTSVNVNIRFASDTKSNDSGMMSEFGDLFCCKVAISDADSRTWSVKIESWCHRHGTRRYMRSGRRLSSPYFDDDLR